jgi:hypothetical protein
VCVCVCACMCLWVCVCACLRVLFLCVHVCDCECICMFACMCLLCVCACVSFLGTLWFILPVYPCLFKDRVCQKPYLYSVYTVFFPGSSPNELSCTVYVYNFGQPCSWRSCWCAQSLDLCTSVHIVHSFYLSTFPVICFCWNAQCAVKCKMYRNVTCTGNVQCSVGMYNVL